MNITLLGIIAGIFTSVAMLPQLIKVLKEKRVENLSPITLIILMTGLSLWVWYGFAKEDIAVIASNLFALLVNGTLLFTFWRYKK